MKRFILPLTLILFLLFTITAFMSVEFVGKNEYTRDGETTITMAAHADTSVGDLLIAYIAKDDNVDIDETGGYGDFTMLFNIIDDSQTCLYLGWRIADSGDADATPTEYTWTSDSEDWVGEMLTYSGNSATPIHNSGSAYLDSSATPTAPSVSFTDLTAGSLVLQVFGCDFDDTPRTVPSQLTSRFNQHQANDIGGAGGDRDTFYRWTSPTSFNDPDSKWTEESNAYDDVTETYATNITGEINHYLELNISSISCDKIRIMVAGFQGGTTYYINTDIDVYYGGDWHNIYSEFLEDEIWHEIAIGSTQNITAARVKFSGHPAGGLGRLYEFDFREIPLLEGTGNTGTAVFGIPASNEWTAVTLVIEAAAAVGGITWNTKTITKFNGVTITKFNTK